MGVWFGKSSFTFQQYPVSRMGCSILRPKCNKGKQRSPLHWYRTVSFYQFLSRDGWMFLFPIASICRFNYVHIWFYFAWVHILFCLWVLHIIYKMAVKTCLFAWTLRLFLHYTIAVADEQEHDDKTTVEQNGSMYYYYSSRRLCITCMSWLWCNLIMSWSFIAANFFSWSWWWQNCVFPLFAFALCVSY